MQYCISVYVLICKLRRNEYIQMEEQTAKDSKHSLGEKFERVALDNLHKVAVEQETENGYVSYTYKDFLENAILISKILQTLEVIKGDRIAILLDNSPMWGFVYFGIMFAEGIAVPLDPQSTSEDIHYFLQDSGSNVIFTSKKYLPSFEFLKDNVPSRKIILVDDVVSAESYSLEPSKIFNYKEMVPLLTDVKSLDFVVPKTSPYDAASIIYTSGTTGKPKGVVLTHNNLYSNYLSIASLGIVKRDDCVLSLLPIHHTFPFMTNLLIPLFRMVRIVYPKTLKSEELLKCIRDSRTTMLVAVPQFYYLFHQKLKKIVDEKSFLTRLLFFTMLECGFFCRKFLHLNVAKIFFKKIHAQFGSKMRYLVSGGAKLDVEIHEFLFKLGFCILEGYGLTETSPVVTLTPPKKPKIGSVGKPIPNVRVKIDEQSYQSMLDEKLDGYGIKPKCEGYIGEILIQGPNVMSGYYKLEDKTNDVLHDGWFYSGDLGYFDSDGYLYVVGRKNELIVLSNGKNIVPEEIERHYLQTMYIKELCVLTVGSGAGEKLMAVIVPDFDYFRSLNESAFYETIKWHLENLSEELPSFKRIMGVMITKHELPRTRLGKLRRYLIKEQYEKELCGFRKATIPDDEDGYDYKDAEIFASANTGRILDVLKKELSIRENIRLDDNLELDFGVNSLKRLELIVAIEKALQVKIPENLIAKIFTVRDLVEVVTKLIGQNKGICGGVSSYSAKNADSVWYEVINEPPPDELLSKIDLSPNLWAKCAAFLVYTFLDVLFRVFFSLKVEGKENLLSSQPFLLCSNHNSYLDGFVLAASFPNELRNNLFFLGFVAFIDVPVIRQLQKLIRIIPISPTEHLVPAMRSGAYVLKNGKILAVFPEAARSIDGEVKEFKKGIGILVKNVKVPVLPLYIKGSFEAWPRPKKIPKLYPIKVIFGKPCYEDELQELGYSLGAKDDYEAIAMGLRKKVVELN